MADGGKHSGQQRKEFGEVLLQHVVCPSMNNTLEKLRENLVESNWRVVLMYFLVGSSLGKLDHDNI